MPANPKSIDISQDTLVKDTCIIHSTINLFMDIGTGYGFCGHHCLKGKIALSLSFSIKFICFNTGCSVILCDITFFCIQVSNTPIQKMATSITIWNLGVNKHATDQYAIADIYIPAKNGQGQEVTTYI